jgi:arylsulfatase A-like enzyme
MNGKFQTGDKTAGVNCYNRVATATGCFPRIRNMGYQAVRTERWKYIHYLELTGADELYDLQADAFELDNLVMKTRLALPITFIM